MTTSSSMVTSAGFSLEACPPAERAARVELAACYRVFDLLGWTELIYNHITVRLPTPPGTPPQFLINPFGLHFSEVTASNLLRIDAAGTVLQDTPYRANPAGFTIHAALHAGIANAHCVMHTHTTAGMAVASLEAGLLQTNFYSAQLHDKVAYHDFEGITLHAEEGPRLLASMGERQALILRNHGLLSWGATLPQAFAILWTLQRACEVQLATLSMGAARPVPVAVARKCAREALQFDPRHGGGRDGFDALVRLVERQDEGYRR